MGHHSARLAARELAAQGLYRLCLGKGQTRSQFFRFGQRLACTGELALSGIQLAAHIVGLGTVGVRRQYLLHHYLRLLQLAGLRSGVNVVQGRLLLSPRDTAGQHAHYQRPFPDAFVHRYKLLAVVTVRALATPSLSRIGYKSSRWSVKVV